MLVTVTTTTTVPTGASTPPIAYPDLNEIVDKLAYGFSNYVSSNVGVTVSPIDVQGTSATPGETFTFHVKVTNNGKVPLKNLKYRVSVGASSIATIMTPPGSNTNFAGDLLAPGQKVKEFIHAPDYGESRLDPGESQELPVYGDAVSGGTTNVKARVTVDIDVDQLCPKERMSKQALQQLDVVD
jgi:hypothetical protein